MITSCQTHQLENNCNEMKIIGYEEDKCKKIISDCESLFSTLLIVYKNDVNTRDEKGRFINIVKLECYNKLFNFCRKYLNIFALS